MYSKKIGDKREEPKQSLQREPQAERRSIFSHDCYLAEPHIHILLNLCCEAPIEFETRGGAVVWWSIESGFDEIFFLLHMKLSLPPSCRWGRGETRLLLSISSLSFFQPLYFVLLFMKIDSFASPPQYTVDNISRKHTALAQLSSVFYLLPPVELWAIEFFSFSSLSRFFFLLLLLCVYNLKKQKKAKEVNERKERRDLFGIIERKRPWLNSFALAPRLKPTVGGWWLLLRSWGLEHFTSVRSSESAAWRISSHRQREVERADRREIEFELFAKF